MSISLFLAQVLGCYFFLISLAMLVHHQRFKKTMHEFLGSSSLISLSGSFSLIFGLLIVASHNIWIAMWPVLITIIGWFLIIQGLMRVFFPERFSKVVKDMMAQNGYLVMCWVWLVIGLFLIWAGFSPGFN